MAHIKPTPLSTDEATEILNTALSTRDNRSVLLGLRKIVESIGFTVVSKVANLDRANLYTMLTTKGNPTFASLHQLLTSLGLELRVIPISAADRAEIRADQILEETGLVQKSMFDDLLSDQDDDELLSEEEEEIGILSPD